MADYHGPVVLFQWFFVGALIGIAAARRNEANVVAYSLGGALLGLAAFLLFFLPPTASRRKRSEESPSLKVKDFDDVYGPGELYDDQCVEGTDRRDWPLTIIYFDKKTGRSFLVGVHTGSTSWRRIRKLKKDRGRLSECRAEVVQTGSFSSPSTAGAPNQPTARDDEPSGR
jgi:hypothetical protein